MEILPEEMINVICLFSQPRELFVLTQCSHQLNRLATQEALWDNRIKGIKTGTSSFETFKWMHLGHMEDLHDLIQQTLSSSEIRTLSQHAERVVWKNGVWTVLKLVGPDMDLNLFFKLMNIRNQNIIQHITQYIKEKALRLPIIRLQRQQAQWRCVQNNLDNIGFMIDYYLRQGERKFWGCWKKKKISGILFRRLEQTNEWLDTMIVVMEQRGRWSQDAYDDNERRLKQLTAESQDKVLPFKQIIPEDNQSVPLFKFFGPISIIMIILKLSGQKIKTKTITKNNSNHSFLRLCKQKEVIYNNLIRVGFT